MLHVALGVYNLRSHVNKMTRYTRSGSTQQHKKMPGNATPWSEFSKQKGGMWKKHKDGKNAPRIKQERKFQQPEFQTLKGSTNEVSPSQPVSHMEIGAKNEIKSTNTSQSIVFEKKKQMYMELQKKGAKKDVPLLPSKIKRKLYNIKKKLGENVSPKVLSQIINKEKGKEVQKFRKKVPSKPCYNCRKIGHFHADCPENTKMSGSREKTKICFRCGSNDHLSKKCPTEIRKKGDSSKPCFNCRQIGHFCSDCPENTNPAGLSKETGICFKCGSSYHTSYKCPSKIQGFPLAKCFVCKEQGHISKDCPSNKHGIYPKGGACHACGNVNHFKKDCPTLKRKKEEETITLPTLNEGTSIDEEIVEKKNIKMEEGTQKPKVVEF